MKLIINADDLGYSVDTNRAIFSLMRCFRITSATLMANGPAFQDAVRHIPDFPNFSFGVHLTLTEFQALTTPQIFYDTKMIDERGVFTRELRKLRPNSALLSAILKEWEQQVLRILDNGVSVSHFDSHHHTHTIPWLFFALKKLQKRFNVRKVRASMNSYYQKEYSPPRRLLMSKKIWNFALRNIYRTRTADYLTFFEWFLANSYDGMVGSQGVAELMCHPGQPASSEVTELLRSDWVARLPFPIELISYHEL